ncbi:hypothetical protein LBMAG42_48440 [Deltaproteobacteria bacterium]|nr:hypothetical protein LBMAG42_48440 [Deltaproteobacteria bacterium]
MSRSRLLFLAAAALAVGVAAFAVQPRAAEPPNPTTPEAETTAAGDAPSTPSIGPSPAEALPSLTTLAPGFELGRLALPTPSALGPGALTYVRVDPTLVRLEVRAASLRDKTLRKASEWGESPPDAKAIAVINSSMFKDDWLSSLGRFVVNGTAQNKGWAEQQNSLFVADPVSKAGPRAALVNLGCADRDATVAAWQTQVQSIRMVGCSRENVWAQEPRSWSSALVGADAQGRILFLHTRAPYTMHDLVDMLLAVPLDIVALHYAEGGPEASLYVRGPGVERHEVGSYETGFVENDQNADEWDLPNVIVAIAP